MDKQSHVQESVELNYLSIPKLQRLHCWNLGMDKQLNPKLYDGCNWLCILGFKLIYISKQGNCYPSSDGVLPVRWTAREAHEAQDLEFYIASDIWLGQKFRNTP